MLLSWTLGRSARHIQQVLIFFALLAGWLTGVPSWAGVVQDVRVQGDRVVLRFNEPVRQASAFVLVGGSGGAYEPEAQGAVGDGSDARVVLDLSRPAIVTEGSFARKGKTLMLQLRTVDDARFARAAAEQRIGLVPPFSYFQASSRHSYSERVAAPPRAAPIALPQIYGSDASRPLVVIDAGHGGHDPGAISPDGKLREKDLTLQVALAIRDALLASGRVRVALTRESDSFLILQERYGIARRLGADLFISIHCDSAGADTASGATVYTLSETASDKEAARLAARENKADILAGVDLGSQSPDISSILIDLTQRETMDTSANFARLLGREAQPLIPIKPNFHRFASLIVLKAPDMPSILFETGYISNASDATFLASEAGRQRVATSVRRAVEIHFATRGATRSTRNP